MRWGDAVNHCPLGCVTEGMAAQQPGVDGGPDGMWSPAPARGLIRDDLLRSMRILAFEAPQLHRIVDLMRELRATQARRHVRAEVPFFTGARVAANQLIAGLP
jgi:Chlorite dismutase